MRKLCISLKTETVHYRRMNSLVVRMLKYGGRVLKSRSDHLKLKVVSQWNSSVCLLPVGIFKPFMFITPNVLLPPIIFVFYFMFRPKIYQVNF